jgi:hypothetical protein
MFTFCAKIYLEIGKLRLILVAERLVHSRVVFEKEFEWMTLP